MNAGLNEEDVEVYSSVVRLKNGNEHPATRYFSYRIAKTIATGKNTNSTKDILIIFYFNIRWLNTEGATSLLAR
jgi:hypothetical protein